MSETKPLNEWINDWQALQRQYLNVWADVASKTPGAAAQQPGNPFGTSPFGANPFGASPFAVPSFGAMPFAAAPFAGMPHNGFGAMPPGWQEGFEQWSRMFNDAGKQSETAERLLASAKSYMEMMQAMFAIVAAQNAGAGTATANPAQAWFESLRNGFAGPSNFNFGSVDASALANNPFARAMRDMAGRGAKGFTELPAAFAPFIEQLRTEGLSWLRLPAFGLGREHQEHYQKTALAFIEYSQALQNYNQLMLKASERGFERFEGKLAERSEPGRTIDSLRALYDLWVDAAEEAYAEIALSEEFAKVYGELANAQMRARAQVQAEVERVSTDLGMPTRSELNGVHQRLHDLRREVRDGSEVQVDASGLEAQIVALREEVQALKQGLARAQASAAVAAPQPVAAAASSVKPAPPSPARPAALARRSVRVVKLTKPRPPAPVVKPRPIAASNGKSAGKENSFGAAIAAMRQRVAGKSGKQKSLAANMAKPSKLHSDKKAGRRK